MKGLVTKEFTLLYKNFWFQILAFFIIGIIGAISDKVYFIIYAYTPLIVSITSMSGIALDETSKWTQYSMSLPVERKDIVTSKYIVLLICSLISTVMVMLFILISMVIKKEISVENMIILSSLSFVISSVFPSLILPFYIKFGTTKGKIIYFLTIGLLCGISTRITSSNDILGYIMKIASHVKVVILCCIGAVTVLMLISWAISSTLYRKKEL